MDQIPRLETLRFILRAPTTADWPAYLRLMTSQRARYMGGPFSPFAAWGQFCAETAQWRLYGVGGLIIIPKAGGEALGLVGINYGPMFPEWELGWMLYDGAEGQGIAQEAAEAMRRWGFGPRGLPTMVSYVDPLNHRSCRLAERLGGAVDMQAPRPDPTDIVYRHMPR